ncbi:MAG TPA: bacteriohemerythrin [Bacteroidota bacterium]|jgi:hemerythrin|nr:bacteriohemerythrin [Bacteroidota bacterium]
MGTITWNDSLSVKVLAIDQQHKKLVDMINELSDAMRSGKGRDVLSKIISGLILYTGTHFKTEEKYFDQFGYPEAEIHKKEHEAFVLKVLEFKKGFEKGDLNLTVEIMDFLSDWLQNHIKGSDKKYSQFFNDHGLH